jgi:hypothetical protein
MSDKPRKIRSDAKLASVMKRAGVDPKVLETPTHRKVRKDVTIETLRKRSK